MSETERIAQMVKDSHAALFGIQGDAANIGLIRQFDIFKTEVVTTVKEQTKATERNNNRQNVIIACLTLLVTAGLLLCAILGIALNRRDTRSMLMTSDPTYTVATEGEHR